jgi:hypothetical protein
MRITNLIKVPISYCTSGVYLRWYYNGWHYFLFTNGYEVQMKTESMDTQVTRMFSVISKIERPTRLKTEYSYQITLEGIKPEDMPGFTGLLLAEKVEQWEYKILVSTTAKVYSWYEVEILRGEHTIKDEGQPSYTLTFEVKRKELPYTQTEYQKSLRLYLGNTLCDLDDDEVVPVNKQVNDIAEMQDRQSDFTAQFKIRKTRAMKALFELSGEVGIDTSFPFEQQECRYVSDNIEVITRGQMILDKVDDQYYYVSILSGNKNFFKTIEKLKLIDLLLPSTNHTWDIADQVTSHTSDLDYVYPLCEPSEDGTIAPMTDDGDRVEMYSGWIWPFIKIKTIWDEIHANVGFVCEGEILTSEVFTHLFMPIVNLNIAKANTSPYLYSAFWRGYQHFNIYAVNIMDSMWLIIGTVYFANTGIYITYFVATYKFRFMIRTLASGPAHVWLYSDEVQVIELTQNMEYSDPFVWDGEYSAVVGENLTIRTSMFYGCIEYTVGVIEIKDVKIGHGAAVTPHLNLPDMTQVDFIKTICNMFGLIPDVTARDRKIRYWNYNDLYDNIPIARDWSAYLSEREDEMEFKFGDYAQNNYLRYKESDDVTKDNGMGTMQINDDTLPLEKEAVQLPISTCDEVEILTNVFSVKISRIGFNKYDSGVPGGYAQNPSIDPRIVYINYTGVNTSPPYEKTFGISPNLALGGATDIVTPKKASSLEVSFPNLVYNYASLSRLLTKTNLRRAKFNLPVYEVAGLKHYIPIYLSQYKAYFYVNKINNYVPGKLCIIDLIKL